MKPRKQSFLIVFAALLTCDEILPGMALAHVESILTRKADSVFTVGGVELAKVWIGENGSRIMVTFDDNGLVVSRHFVAGGKKGD